MRDQFIGKLFVLLAIILFSIYASAFPAVTNFNNGSFETGDLTDWSISVVRSDVATTTVSGSNTIVSGDASDGSFSFDMNAAVGLIGQNNRSHFRRTIMLNTLDFNLFHDTNIIFDFKLVSASFAQPFVLISYTEIGDTLKLFRDNGTCVGDNNANVSNVSQTLDSTSYGTFGFVVPTCVNMDSTKPVTISFI